MKNLKLLFTLALLIAFSLMHSQPKPFKISQQLQLEIVPLGASSDSVMVWGADKLVKFIPKSYFTGGSQTLEQVLIAGNTSGENINIENDTQFARLSPSSVSISIDEMGVASEGELGYAQLKFSSDSGYYNRLIPNNSSISDFIFPEKEGIFTLATLDDIPSVDLSLYIPIAGYTNITGVKVFSSPLFVTDLISIEKTLNFSSINSLNIGAYTGQSILGTYNGFIGMASVGTSDGGVGYFDTTEISSSNSVGLKFPITGGTIATTDDFNKSYTVSTLPTLTGTAFAIVTDALTPTYMATIVGGGSVVCPVFFNGTTWVAH